MKRILLTAALLALPAFSQQTCPGFANCIYAPSQTYAVSKTTLRVTYNDVADLPRTFEVTARIPNRTGALPVMIWAHGGAEGRNSVGGSVGALEQWSEVTSVSGYLTISPAFRARTDTEQAALCVFLGADEDECLRVNSTSWDRPYDIKAIIDALAEQNKSGPLQGRIDMNRIGVGGHSAGSSGTLSVAGAAREYAGKRYGPSYFADPRPKAFVALSPSAPGLSYLFDTSFNDASTSWDTVRGPVLMATGAGDAHEQFGRGRRIPYTYLPSGDKYRLWFNDEDFGHEAFGDGLEDCGGGVNPRKCEAFQATLMSTVRAFLDAYIEQKAQAMTYLQNGFVERLSQGQVEWLKK